MTPFDERSQVGERFVGTIRPAVTTGDPSMRQQRFASPAARRRFVLLRRLRSLRAETPWVPALSPSPTNRLADSHIRRDRCATPTACHASTATPVLALMLRNETERREEREKRPAPWVEAGLLANQCVRK